MYVYCLLYASYTSDGIQKTLGALLTPGEENRGVENRDVKGFFPLYPFVLSGF